MPLAVCATPIGNLEDVTLRVLAELAAADVVLCEDTRHTRGLLERHGIRARLLSYHEHNEAQRTAELVPRLEAGERVALVSDAGLPGVSDPGARLVRGALDAGIDVTVLPGPSAVETALVASGLVAEQYRFLGFLPRSESKLASLWEELRGWPWPAVAFESPQRLPGTLRSLAAFDSQREVSVCRELTKRFEEVVRGTADEVAERFDTAPKGEITLVLGPAARVDEGRASSGARGRRRARGGRRAAAAGGRDRLGARRDLAQPPLQAVTVSRFDNRSRPRYSGQPVARTDNDTAAGGSSSPLPGVDAGRVRHELAVQGPVLRPFAYDEAHPYAAGQHRGIDIGAAAAGETVVAPSAGTVSFAGTVPTNGKSVTIVTADGYSVTLTHLGSILVAKGAAVAERDAIGTIGPSGTPEFARPYVHLGIRARPMRTATSIRSSSCRRSGRRCNGERSGSIAARPSAVRRPHRRQRERDPSGGVREPIRSFPDAEPERVDRRGSTALEAASRGSNHAHERSQEPRSSRSLQRPGEEAIVRRPCVRRAGEFAWTACRRALCHGRLSTGGSRRAERSRRRPRDPADRAAAQLSPARPDTPTVPVPLILNGAAARSLSRQRSWPPAADAAGTTARCRAVQTCPGSRRHSAASRAA